MPVLSGMGESCAEMLHMPNLQHGAGWWQGGRWWSSKTREVVGVAVEGGLLPRAGAAVQPCHCTSPAAG